MGHKDPTVAAAYRRDYYRTNHARLSSERRDRRARNRSIVDTAKDVPCADCGVRYPPFVMDFDHRDGKGDDGVDISRLAGSGVCSVARLEAEIAKCDVVCANCHRVRTHARGWYIDRHGVAL